VATKEAYSVGQLVEHPQRPQWGPGRIVAKEGEKLFVFFRDSMEDKAKAILTDLVPLRVCETQTDDVLNNLAEPKFDGQHWVLTKPKAKRPSAKKALA
jgi:hypothetical protein